MERLKQYDLIVVGSGIAGLYAALLGSQYGRVLLVTKGKLEESNTRYAQGGIAAAIAPGDSPELHARDTLAAGDGVCDPDAVDVLTREAGECIAGLLDAGVPFDRIGGDLAWTLEAAHSLPRILHVGGDATGAGIERTLAGTVRAAGIDILEETLCLSLLGSELGITGTALLLPDASEVRARASAVILATGGAGQLFARTTNPAVATGDGLALAYRAGAELMDLEFIQFHPTALALEGAPSFLISEAVRGEGGILRDESGRAFMADYHLARELAPRDVVARAIHSQMAKTGTDHVRLDMTHLDSGKIEARFPSIVRFCRAHGIDPVRDSIPVSPAAHYIMGGVRTDLNGRTILPGLYACGEVACTGLHGANRLASNSLMEGLVFARRAVLAIVDGRDAARLPDGEWLGSLPLPPIDLPALSHSGRASLAAAMWRDASLVRSGESLRRAHAVLSTLVPTTPGRESLQNGNLALVAGLVTASALLREESRGAHFRSDAPKHETRWLGHTVIHGTEASLAPLLHTRVPEALAV